MPHLINAEQLDKHDENPHAEIQIARGRGAHGGGQRQPAQAHGEHERALALQNEIRDLAVARRDHEAKKKSRNFQGHIEIVSRAVPRLNRPKTLIRVLMGLHPANKMKFNHGGRGVTDGIKLT